ncbi:MAG: gliding motility protein GldN, partial [Hymenobacteraceae bacterium]|nr:gliding motility protein GldN [Hymenobacteraceae bacterium]MDX5394693.1 gliding motility protein GldN [Hymenobacteraceae bacterium]MDX5510724.1 gliding motility protein GldN [Hymenobacteraceae bacterium]
MKALNFVGLAAGLALSFASYAQQSYTTSGTNSARPIPKSDILFQKTVWRGIDLREKQNKPMFSTNREISRILIDAVKSGELQAYANDSLTRPITREEFIENMTPDNAGFEVDTLASDNTDDWGKAGGGQQDAPIEVSNEYFPNQLYQLELKEDVIFDKKRSRMYHDIQAISLKVPASLPANEKGFEINVGSFKYSDLVRVFRNHPEQAVWFNPQNDAQHKNLADAFDLWLFSS